MALIKSPKNYVIRDTYLKDGAHGLSFQLARSQEQLQMFVQQNLNNYRKMWDVGLGIPLLEKYSEQLEVETVTGNILKL